MICAPSPPQMSRKEIMKQIGRLFLLRVNISLVGSMIDSPVRPVLLPRANCHNS